MIICLAWSMWIDRETETPEFWMALNGCLNREGNTFDFRSFLDSVVKSFTEFDVPLHEHKELATALKEILHNLIQAD